MPSCVIWVIVENFCKFCVCNKLQNILSRRFPARVIRFMSRLKPSERSKIKQMGEIIEREGSTYSNLSSSLSNLPYIHSSLSSTHSSSPLSLSSLSTPITSSSCSIGDNIVCLVYPVEPVEKASSSTYNNQQYDANSNSLDALRSSQSSGQVSALGSIYDSPDNVLDFSASVEMTKQAKKMTSLISTILYDIGSDNVTWLWLALYVLTYR